MSNHLVSSIKGAKSKFIEVSKELGTTVKYQSESMFAMQQVSKNEFSLKTAQNNSDSLRNSIINIAQVGLSLNPALQHAFLIPRDGAIVLDISYRGMIQIATDTGSIMWAKADLVYDRDTFLYRGPSEKPRHECNPFSGDRGNVVGVYCIAKTHEGDHLVELMSMAEIDTVRKASKAYNPNNQRCPWIAYFGEMAKKSVIKRASKTWPKTDRNNRLDEALSIVNSHEGMREEVDITPATVEQVECIENLGWELEIEIGRILNNYGLKEFNVMTFENASNCINLLNGFAANKETIFEMRKAFAENDLCYAQQLWSDLNEAEQNSLWHAPTKGGPFTTKQREIIKNGFREAA